jgi:hypothetical protein
MICYIFGDVFYVDEQLFMYISHGDNVSSAGDDKVTLKKRKKQIFKQGAYMNFASTLLDFYSDLLSQKQINYLKMITDYKKSFCKRIFLFFSPTFVRFSLLGTISLKLHILLGFY